jgi:hypothetical protein
LPFPEEGTRLAFWFTVCAAGTALTGGSLTAVTSNRNPATAVLLPSLTDTVIVVVPLWLAAGVMVSVRSCPLAPGATLILDMSA